MTRVRRKALGRRMFNGCDLFFLWHGLRLLGATLRGPDDPAVASAWARHRGELLADCEPGARPWAWWCFDAPYPLRGQPLKGGAAVLALAEHGLLSDAELAYLRRHGRPLMAEEHHDPTLLGKASVPFSMEEMT